MGFEKLHVTTFDPERLLLVLRRSNVRAPANFCSAVSFCVSLPSNAHNACKSTPQPQSLGNMEAQLILGELLMKPEPGDDKRRNHTPESIEWIARAAKQGNVRAQFNLSGAYVDGLVLAMDRGQAIRWIPGSRRGQRCRRACVVSARKGTDKERLRRRTRK